MSLCWLCSAMTTNKCTSRPRSQTPWAQSGAFDDCGYSNRPFSQSGTRGPMLAAVILCPSDAFQLSNDYSICKSNWSLANFLPDCLRRQLPYDSAATIVHSIYGVLSQKLPSESRFGLHFMLNFSFVTLDLHRYGRAVKVDAPCHLVWKENKTARRDVLVRADRIKGA